MAGMKRTLCHLLGLVSMAMIAVAAVAIRVNSPGPVIFRQERLGLGRHPFVLYKFRTMQARDNDAPHRAYVRSLMDRTQEADSDGLYKLRRDDVITSVGRWLRKYSLDELPQLVNVLRGDMSLVGPRPSLEYELEGYLPYHFERFLVKPGLTGLWQVTARAHSTHIEALDMDVAYVRNWSPSLDFWLVCRTPMALIRQRNATA